MKRCPQCHFIYPEADRICDFDQSPLVDTTEAEIAAITNTPERPKLADLAASHTKSYERRRTMRVLHVTVALGLLLGIVLVGIYLAVRHQVRPTSSEVAISQEIVQPAVIPQTSPSPSALASQSPSPSPGIASAKPANPNSKSIGHSTTSSGPVSTSPQEGKKGPAKSVIVLTTGSKVEADEVWRTRDGVWYRRNGVVTLLKKNRVRAIVN